LEDENVDIVLLEALEALKGLNLPPLVIHKKTCISLPLGPGSNITMESFSSANYRGEDVDGSPFQM
tara:strand:+ start:174 stop:371 length:198 start_codon:yes stop_codon:yes gene_type:complete